MQHQLLDPDQLAGQLDERLRLAKMGPAPDAVGELGVASPQALVEADQCEHRALDRCGEVPGELPQAGTGKRTEL